MSKERIYVVEDQEDILELITFNLNKEGYQVEGFPSGEDMFKVARNVKPDCLILDLMLPGMDGLEICKTVKSDDALKDVAVIMVTAKGEESDIVAGLELGADDYIVKPFSPRILLARLRAILRRKKSAARNTNEPAKTVEYENISVNTQKHEVRINNEVVELTSSEFNTLYFLISHPGWVYTRSQIVERIHGENYPVTDRSIDVLIVSLRKKMGDAGAYIQTVRGVGYKFKELTYDE